MESALFLLLFVLVACAGTNEERPILYADCPEIHVVRVLDGDSLETGQGEVDLFGINAPELTQLCASEPKERLREMAEYSIRIEFGPRRTDQSGRLLVYGYTQLGVSIDETLIREGLATASTLDGQHQDYLMRLEREANRQETGCLWGPSVSGQQMFLVTPHP